MIGDNRSLERAFSRSSSSARGFEHMFGRAAANIAKAGIFAGAAAGATAFFTILHEGTQRIVEAQKASAQTAAALKSTGGAAGISAKQVSDLALRLSNLSGANRDVVQSGENMLLSFTKIRNQAGKGNDIFNRATKAVLDFATRTGRDVPTAAVLLGKALEDPATKVAALARAGIVFSASQKKVLKSLVDSGHQLEAQKLILGELTKRFGGAAAAAGKTLPGRLGILHDRFKDLSAEILSVAVPTFTKVVSGLTDFVRKLSELRGFKAKFDFAFTGGKELVARLFGEIGAQIRATDWKSVFTFVGDQWRAALVAEGRLLARVDFGAVGQELGARLQQSLAGITDFIRSVDWSRVGGAIVSGIIDFLRGVNWVALFKGIVRLQVAALKAAASLFFGAGKALFEALVAGMRSLELSAIHFVEKVGLELVAKVVGAFGFLGRFDPFKGLEKKVQARLAQMGVDAESATARIQRAIDSVHGKTVKITIKGENISIKGENISIGGKNLKPQLSLPNLKPATAAAARAATAQVAAIGDQTVKSAGQAKSAAEKAAAALQKVQDAFAKLMDALSLGLEKAQATSRLSDDIAAQEKINAAIRREIKLEGKTTDLARQLFEGRQALAQLVSQQRQAKQFTALGLTAAGEQRTPGVGALSKRLASLRNQVKGTFLDTAKTRSELQRIAKVLSGQFGKVGVDVRQAILQMENDIANALKGGTSGKGPITPFRVPNASEIVKQFPSLSPSDKRKLERLLSRRGAGGTVAQGSRVGGAFGVAVGAGGGGGGITININGDVVTPNAEKFLRDMERRARRTTRSRTGSGAGRRIGGV